MGLDLDPAALGGLAGLIALASWAVGRMQGGRREGRDAALQAPQAPQVPHSAAAAPPLFREAEPVCRQRAFEERRALHAAPVSLADLHAEAAAIRRDARIFAQDGAGAALLALTGRQSLGDCRYLGLSGQPTCPAPLACASCGAAQLSAEPASLTRV